MMVLDLAARAWRHLLLTWWDFYQDWIWLPPMRAGIVRIGSPSATLWAYLTGWHVWDALTRQYQYDRCRQCELERGHRCSRRAGCWHDA